MANAKLFDNPYESINLLPYEGEAIYHGKIFTDQVANHYFETLLRTIRWRSDTLIMYGKEVTTKRKIAWYGNHSYTYSGTTRKGNSWPDILLELKKIVEDIEGVTYNACLLNLYETGEQGMGWHNDEESLDPRKSIASLSLGAERRFDFRHMKTKKTISTILENGGLLIMRGVTQQYWLHHVPTTKKIKGARINITFRQIKD